MFDWLLYGIFIFMLSWKTKKKRQIHHKFSGKQREQIKISTIVRTLICNVMKYIINVIV